MREERRILEEERIAFFEFCGEGGKPELNPAGVQVLVSLHANT